MKQKINNSEVKKRNRNRVFRYVNGREKTSMPDIAAELDMSVPTVLQIVKELKEAGVVCEVGEFESTGGRKPKAIAAIRDIHYAVGIDITSNHVSLVLTDLKETVLKHTRIRKPFFCEDDYFRQVGIILEAFLEENEEWKSKVAGVGIAVPGIINGSGEKITYSKRLGLYELDIDKFLNYIPYPCVLINDASAAAVTECISGKYPEGMIYLSLSNSVGGAIVFGQEKEAANTYGGMFRSMYMGRHWHSAEFGHMVIHPGGKKCYCGKLGCVDTYCSAMCLAENTDGNLKEFFDRMDSGEQTLIEIWDNYLEDLAVTVDNLRMCFDCDIVLGGYVGSLMGPYLAQLRHKVSRRNIFEGGGKYVRTCTYQLEASALGAAIFFIEDYIDSI